MTHSSSDARGPATGEAQPRPRPSPWAVTAVSGALIVLTVLGYAGFGLIPALVPDSEAVNSAPNATLLIALNPSAANFLLVTNTLDPWTYFGFGVPRVLLSDPLYYMLGWWFGTSAISWMERRTRTWGSMLRQVEQAFGKYGYLFLFALPYPQLALLAGAARLPLLRVLAVSAAGISVRLFLIRRTGEVASGPLSSVTDWISDYRAPLLAVSAGLVALSIAMELKKGESQVESLANLDEEIDEIEHSEHPRRNDR